MRAGTLPPQFGVVPNPTCTTSGCDRPAYSKWKSRCRGHEEFERLTGKPAGNKRHKIPNGAEKPKCSKGGCNAPVRSNGICGNHYYQVKHPPKSKPCLHQGCLKTTVTGHCAEHKKQFDKYGFTWSGKTPNHKIRAWRDEQKPYCSVGLCLEKTSSLESKLCRKHRADWGRKNCELDYYIKLMDRTKCDSCGAEPEKLVTDHDHSCEHPTDSMCQSCIRGRLCSGCNTALGLLREDLKVIESLGEYLEKHTDIEG